MQRYNNSYNTYKKQEKKAGTSFVFLFPDEKIWSDYSWKLICVDQSRFYNFLQAVEIKDVQYNFKIF